MTSYITFERNACVIVSKFIAAVSFSLFHFKLQDCLSTRICELQKYRFSVDNIDHIDLNYIPVTYEKFVVY